MVRPFTQRIVDRLNDGRSAVVVGLDPRLEALPDAVATDAEPVERIVTFYRETLPLLAEHAVAVKPNIAFFEQHGAAGYVAYEATCQMARKHNLPVIGDIKRGDIGSTAAAYAAAHWAHADAVTLHPYMGSDSIEPFLPACRDDGRAVFVLVRTSNPSGAELQEQRLDSGVTLAEDVAARVARWGWDMADEYGYSAVGAVVGATVPGELARLRELMPRAWLLIPGVGAQGGAVADLAPAFDSRGYGALVNQSRGIMQCFSPSDPDWRDRIEAELLAFSAELRFSRHAEIDEHARHDG